LQVQQFTGSCPRQSSAAAAAAATSYSSSSWRQQAAGRVSLQQSATARWSSLRLLPASFFRSSLQVQQFAGSCTRQSSAAEAAAATSYQLHQ